MCYCRFEICILGSSLEIFGYLRKSSKNFRRFSENVRERLSGLRAFFGVSSTTFEKCSEFFGKLSKSSLLVFLYSKQNNTYLRVDSEFFFKCSTWIDISYEWARGISCRTLEEQFHIHALPHVLSNFRQNVNQVFVHKLSLFHIDIRKECERRLCNL